MNGQRIAEARKAKKMPQSALGKLLGVSQQAKTDRSQNLKRHPVAGRLRDSRMTQRIDRKNPPARRRGDARSIR